MSKVFLTENNARVGQVVEMDGDCAQIAQVIEGIGIKIDTLGAGRKLRIPYLFTELIDRGVTIEVEG